ncbi:MAG: hypothetical protein H6730_15870 [Deltaproteobacteria bacterium]|nr:hypothetical protein [Deltaproteobacteria bacterium]
MSAAWAVIVLTTMDGGAARAVDVLARADQQVSLHVAVREEGAGRCVLYTDAPKVRSGCVVRGWPKGWSATWYKVESAEAAYDNLAGGRFAFAPIRWTRSRWRDAVSVEADVTPILRQGLPEAWKAGTMRYQVAVSGPGGGVVWSPGLEEAAPGGPKRRNDIRKVTLRWADTYLGYMAELAGLPYVFGSAAQGREPHQAERRVGVDCADLMVYGLRRMGHDVAYRSSRTLSPVSRAVVPRITARKGGVYLFEGAPITVGPDGVRPGDWLVFEGHVGAFVADRGQLGVLDEQDLLMHIAWRELAVEPLLRSGYGAAPFEIRRANALALESAN